MWTKGRRRNDTPAVAALICGLGSVRAIAKAAGVSTRAVQFWRQGIKRPSMATLQKIIERLMPLTGGGTMLSGQIEIDQTGDSSPVGIGDYTRHSAGMDAEYDCD